MAASADEPEASRTLRNFSSRSPRWTRLSWQASQRCRPLALPKTDQTSD